MLTEREEYEALLAVKKHQPIDDRTEMELHQKDLIGVVYGPRSEAGTRNVHRQLTGLGNKKLAELKVKYEITSD